MKDQFLKFWKDPVWSKVISAGIIALIIFAYNYTEALIKKESFKKTTKIFWEQEFKLWQFSLLTFISIISFFAYKKYKQQNKVIENSFKDVDVNTINIFREENNEYDEESRNADKYIFNDIRNNILPATNGIYWLRNQNFRGFSFDPKNMDDFDEFEEICKNPNYTFLNKELENKKQNLQNKVAKFTELIALNTWSTNRGLQTVPPEWEIEQPDRFSSTVKDIHSIAFEIIDLYDEFIKTGKQILKI